MDNNFWMKIEEQDFLLSFIKKDHTMLEYGSGNSTLILQRLVKKLVSIEHDKEWFNKINLQIQESVEYFLCEANNSQWENQFSFINNDTLIKNTKADDGGLEDFYSYILAPFKTGYKFDRIFIDGRARVACAFVSMFLLKPNGKIFIHDFGPNTKHPYLPYRTYYDIVYNFLEEVDHVDTMYCFRVKK